MKKEPFITAMEKIWHGSLLAWGFYISMTIYINFLDEPVDRICQKVKDKLKK